MKRKKLNSQQLGLLSMALIQNSFPKPYKGQIMVDENPGDEGCILYFDDDYHENLDVEIRKNYFNGEFSSSNNEKGWIDLMTAINTAEEINEDVDKSKLTNYHILQSDIKEIKANYNKLIEILNSERPIKNAWIGNVMGDLSEDIIAIYPEHKIGYNFNGYLSIEKTIDENSKYAADLEIDPLWKIFRKYNVEVKSFSVHGSSNSKHISARIYLEN